MITVSQTIIKKIDLEKLMKNAGIKSFRKLAGLAEIDYPNLLKIKNNNLNMSHETWNKIKLALEQYAIQSKKSERS